MVPPIAQLVAEEHKLRSRNPKSITRFHVAYGISAYGAFSGKNYQVHSCLAGQPGHVIVDSNGPLCGCGRRLPACGPRPFGRRWVWHCTPQRHFALILCFHRHSRFVPSILRSASGGAQNSRSELPSSDVRTEAIRPTLGLALYASAPILYLSFVFIDILALFRQFDVERRSRRVAVRGRRQRPGNGIREPAVCATLDFLDCPLFS